MPKVSVIIPVYNVEAYLRECLDSVVCQTLSDIEIICIDDGSTDQSPEILREYASKDGRIVLISSGVNEGQSTARNWGLEVARGKYIYFVDSDDYIVPDGLERLYGIAEEHDLDLLRCAYQIIPGDNEVKNDSRIIGRVCTGPQLFYEIVNTCHIGPTPWLHFVKTELVRQYDLGFVGRYYEDNLFSLDVIFSAKRSMCVNEVVYVYRTRLGSLMNTPMSLERLRSYTEIIETIIKKYLFGEYSFQMKQALLIYASQLYRYWLFILQNVNTPHDLTGWDQDTVDIYHMLYQHADGGSVVLKNLDLLRRSRVYVYGGGAVAVRLLNALDLYDIPVEGILVTDPTKGKKTALGRRVQGFHETAMDVESDVVIVAVANKYQQEICDGLARRGVKRIIPYTYL